MHQNQLVGSLGEKKAAEFITNLGYKVIEKNFKCKLGEIDIIAFYKNKIVFIEVKTRSSNLFGSPAEAVSKKKLNSIIKTLQFYLKIKNNTGADFRIDVIEIYMLPEDKIEINHIKNITM